MAASSRFWLWRLPAAVASTAAAFFAVGFWLALRGATGDPIGGPPPAPAQAPIAKAAGQTRLLVLGDSLARGTGDETGKGFAGHVQDALRSKGPVETINLAVPGAVSADLAGLVASPNVAAIAASSDVILVSIGGNDLTGAVASPSASLPRLPEEVASARSRFAESLRAIVTRLRDANPRAPIYLVGLYDPFGGSRVGSSVIAAWNLMLQETALSRGNVHVVPTFDLFRARPDRLGADRFHPGARGYKDIAARIIQLLPQS